MSTVTKISYGASGQAITCTFTSLLNNAARQSQAIDNTTDLFLDYLISIRVKSGSAGTSTSGTVNVWAAGSVDAGSTFTEGATGSDAAITLTSPTNLKLVGIANVVANATEYRAGPFSLAAAFGGSVPARFSLVVENKSGGTLDGTIAALTYQAVYLTEI